VSFNSFSNAHKIYIILSTYGDFRCNTQVKLHVDGRLYVPLGSDPEILDDWPIHRAKQVHSTRLYVGACWHGKNYCIEY